MSQKIRMLLPVIGFALASCQSLGQQHQLQFRTGVPPSWPCNSASCDIPVDYEDDSNTNCGDYCYPLAPVHVIVEGPSAGSVRNDIVMIWKLPSGSDARFPQDGILFESGSHINCSPGDPDNANNKHAYWCKNPHVHSSNDDGWKYTVKLLLGNGKKLRTLDPWVVNK